MKINIGFRAITIALLSFLLETVAARGADAGGSFHPVDLTAHYNQLPGSFSPGGCWSLAPMGRQVFDGVPFELGGVMELTGLGAARDGFIFPGRHTDISVGCKGAWIHVFQGAGYAAEDGTVIAYLRLRYAGGLRRELPLCYGVHTRNWWVEPSEPKSALADPNSKVAWTSFSKEDRPQGIRLRLFKTSFPNPEPNRTIETIEMASAFSQATPFIVGITVGDAGAGVNPNAATPATLVAAAPAREVALVVREQASDRPIAGARLRLSITDAKREFSYGEQLTDATGHALVDCPEHMAHLLITASAPGLAFQRRVADLKLPRQEITLKLEPGRAIGGFVRDLTGQPVAGARITISQTAKDETGRIANSELGPLLSGQDGRWECSNISARAEELSFTVTHAQFLTAMIDEVSEGQPDEISVLRDDLYAAKAVFKMRPIGSPSQQTTVAPDK
jgi:hypothetical protein